MKQVSQDTVVQAISLLQQGKSVREVERVTGLSGRPKLLSATDERYCVRQVTKNRISSATKVAKELEKDTGRKVSVDTVCRALHKAGLVRLRSRRSLCLVRKTFARGFLGVWLTRTGQ
ncbi:hypothetical protein G6F16_013681 [Rhizopus arrhizus]|nr:hypothetical protein G6F21_012483 [Rhizopus arrhizus]KAG0808637.1 hypothetical protein G6F19_013699 [Rhizopus arrhizus]KAG0854895.1 hypothetical protein G6F16_013681 [Rhizopus arrhizus]